MKITINFDKLYDGSVAPDKKIFSTSRAFFLKFQKGSKTFFVIKHREGCDSLKKGNDKNPTVLCDFEKSESDRIKIFQIVENFKAKKCAEDNNKPYSFHSIVNDFTYKQFVELLAHIEVTNSVQENALLSVEPIFDDLGVPQLINGGLEVLLKNLIVYDVKISDKDIEIYVAHERHQSENCVRVENSVVTKHKEKEEVIISNLPLRPVDVAFDNRNTVCEVIKPTRTDERTIICDKPEREKLLKEVVFNDECVMKFKQIF